MARGGPEVGIVLINLYLAYDAHRESSVIDSIAANVAAAKALEAKTAPVVYRIHEPPSREKLIALRDYLATMGKKLALGQVVTPSLFNRMLKDVTDEAEKALETGFVEGADLSAARAELQRALVRIRVAEHRRTEGRRPRR